MNNSEKELFTWKKITQSDGMQKPSARRYHSSVVFDNKMYIFGGNAWKKSNLNDLWVFNYDLNEWKQLTNDNNTNVSWPEGRCRHSAVVCGNKMYVFGGEGNNGEVFDDLWVFNFDLESWTNIKKELNQMWPSGRFHHGAVLIGGQSLIIGCGLHSKNNYLSDFWEFNFFSRLWKPLRFSQTIEGRAGLVMFCDQKTNSIHIYGGYCGEGGFTYLEDHLYLVSLTDNICSKIEINEDVIPFSARGIVSCQWKGSEKFFVFGGFDGKFSSDKLFIYNTNEKKFSEISELWLEFDELSAIAAGNNKTRPNPRYGNSIAFLKKDDNESLLLIFGGSASTFLDDLVEISIPN